MSELRTERTFGVTGSLRPLQRAHLLAFVNSEVYPDVLDVMEMVCIQMETKLINTEPDEEASVLANHRMAKAAWQIFTHLQQIIAAEASAHLQAVTKPPPVPALTPLEQFTENLLDPTKPPPDEDFRM